MIVINMAVRCDITSVVYAIWLGAFLVLGRQNSSIVWPVYVGFLAVLLPLQYLLVLGWPPALCLGESTFFWGGGGGRGGGQRSKDGDSTRLPPTWPGFDSRTRRHMWAEFVVGTHPGSKRFFPGTRAFPSPQKPTFPNSSSI